MMFFVIKYKSTSMENDKYTSEGKDMICTKKKIFDVDNKNNTIVVEENFVTKNINGENDDDYTCFKHNIFCGNKNIKNFSICIKNGNKISNVFNEILSENGYKSEKIDIKFKE